MNKFSKIGIGLIQIDKLYAITNMLENDLILNNISQTELRYLRLTTCKKHSEQV